jgi:hypothetical protein
MALTGALQENILVVLAFDEERASTIRNVVDVGLYGGPYKIIASRIYDYIDKYKKPPGDHLADILDDKLKGDNKREGELYTDILTSMHEAQEGLNTEYVMTQLETFTRRQSLRSVAVDLAKALQRDTEDSLEEADKLIRAATTNSLKLFDPGLRLNDVDNALSFFDLRNEAFPTGIAELDKRGFGPTRKELWLGIANTKGGKTWMLMHLARIAATHRLKVCHITLEMSEARAAQRYFQSFFAISKRKENFNAVRFTHDSLGRIADLDRQPISAAFAYDDTNARSKVEKRIHRGSRTLGNIIVKQFPTGQLTVPQLRGYLENLEATERFIPDLLVIDYPDLMKIDKTNPRWSLDELYKDIRGLMVERNIAGAVVSQSHRAASKVKLVGADNVAEAYSKVAHADTIITLSQTKHEKAMGLARLHVAAGRNDLDGITIVISQNYGTGQFIVDSTLMLGNYFGLIPNASEEE